MLTGDKLETATCIAKSSRLVSRNQECYIFSPITSRTDAHLQLNNFRKKQDCALIISGDSLEVSNQIPKVFVIRPSKILLIKCGIGFSKVVHIHVLVYRRNLFPPLLTESMFRRTFTDLFTVLSVRVSRSGMSKSSGSLL